MKNRTLLTLTLVSLFALPGFAQDTTWYDAAWKKTSPATAAAYRVKVKDSIGWQLTYYYISGKLKSRGSYTDDTLEMRQGPFVYYDETGQLIRRVNYSRGKTDGQDT